ncbi:TPA: hypothetical protein ACFKZP_07400 [Neisseria gonorrhoeae]|uniref:Uncharacterized protein n=3 Tax=Neisseria gonorrhoeae TaxID=485 RepID=Q5F672_NEIG1|nr:hypothetical protein NGO_1691 [Neisseria gonorrhoeae FA 1090]ANJ49157.1 hypothetical protein ASO12_09285 [Neisseria gonorrhoeae]EFE05056.1 conserved hypothetical protein [Neisseria gonorrhoeae DGI2]ANJ51369.1 hypothetical protein A9Y60_09245 [Neisseria gonorrhoeae]ANJ53567.1 hypothetical protein A9Y61_09265 [Neisseria gonorrhoeae]
MCELSSMDLSILPPFCGKDLFDLFIRLILSRFPSGLPVQYRFSEGCGR